jgi:hypothetical protein
MPLSKTMPDPHLLSCLRRYTGYLSKFVGGTICYGSSKQKLVTTSTTEAEYVSLTYATKEAT